MKISIYKKNKIGQRYEYRKSLEKLEGKEIEIKGTLKIIRPYANTITVRIDDIYTLDNIKLTNHAHMKPCGNNKKQIRVGKQIKNDYKIGDVISLKAKVYKYETEKEINFGMSIVEIL